MSKEPTLGQRVKAYRLEREWSQVEMAKHLGVSRLLIIQLEKGHENIMDLTRVKIEKRLGVQPTLA